MEQSSDGGNEVKMYSDFKSPYAFLAFDPGMALPLRFDVSVRWIPFQLRLKGKGERSQYSEYKVKYSYMDARRHAKARGLWIRGPLKVYDTTPAAIGGLFAQMHHRFLDYGRLAFKHFFLREFEAGSEGCRFARREAARLRPRHPAIAAAIFAASGAKTSALAIGPPGGRKATPVQRGRI